MDNSLLWKTMIHGCFSEEKSISAYLPRLEITPDHRSFPLPILLLCVYPELVPEASINRINVYMQADQTQNWNYKSFKPATGLILVVLIIQKLNFN